MLGFKRDDLILPAVFFVFVCRRWMAIGSHAMPAHFPLSSFFIFGHQLRASGIRRRGRSLRWLVMATRAAGSGAQVGHPCFRNFAAGLLSTRRGATLECILSPWRSAPRSRGGSFFDRTQRSVSSCRALIGLALMSSKENVPKIYAANLAGSAVGALGSIVLLGVFPPNGLLIPMSLLVLVGGFTLVLPSPRKDAFYAVCLAIAGIVTASVSLFLLIRSSP